MVNFAAVQAGANTAWNTFLSSANRVPVLPGLVSLFLKHAVAVPAQGLASLFGRAAVPARTELRNAAALYVIAATAGLVTYKYGRTTATTIGSYTGITARVEKRWFEPARKAVTDATRAINHPVTALGSAEEKAKDAAQKLNAAEHDAADLNDLKANAEAAVTPANEAAATWAELAAKADASADALAGWVKYLTPGSQLRRKVETEITEARAAASKAREQEQALKLAANDARSAHQKPDPSAT